MEYTAWKDTHGIVGDGGNPHPAMGSAESTLEVRGVIG